VEKREIEGDFIWSDGSNIYKIKTDALELKTRLFAKFAGIFEKKVPLGT